LVEITGHQATLRWDPSGDAEGSGQSVSYNIMVGTKPGGYDIVSPLSVPESGFRRMPKRGAQGACTFSTLANLAVGTYYWRVQSIDHQYAGSTFSEEQSFTVSATSADLTPVVPATFNLEQNYPNPFNPASTVTFSIPVAADVKISVFDLLGREVAVLVNEWKLPGRYEVTFDAAGLSSGAYLYRMAAGQHVEGKRMLIVR
jgi:hypothetical protein